MARDSGAEDVLIVDHDTNKIKAVINDVAYLVVSTTGTVAAYPALSAALARVDQLDSVYRVVLADATTANFGIVLPSASQHPGKVVTVKKIDQGANLVFVSGCASEKVDDAAFYTIKSANASATFISDGVGWKCIGLSSASVAATI